MIARAAFLAVALLAAGGAWAQLPTSPVINGPGQNPPIDEQNDVASTIIISGHGSVAGPVVHSQALVGEAFRPQFTAPLHYFADSLCGPWSKPAGWPSEFALLIPFNEECSVSQQLVSAQNEGAILVLKIAPDDSAQLPHLYGNGGTTVDRSVRIPLFVIPRATGTATRDCLGGSGGCIANQPLDVHVEWAVRQQANAFWQLYSTPLPNEVLQGFRTLHEGLRFESVFEPRFYVIDGSAYGCTGAGGEQLCGRSQCTNGGRYCLSDYSNVLRGFTGVALLEETVRSRCLWQQVVADYTQTYGRKWWIYTQLVHADCGSPDTLTEACSAAAADNAGLDVAAMRECVQLAGGTTEDVENSILKGEMQSADVAGITWAPQLRVNNVNYFGAVTDTNTLSVICASISPIDQPSLCDCFRAVQQELVESEFAARQAASRCMSCPTGPDGHVCAGRGSCDREDDLCLCDGNWQGLSCTVERPGTLAGEDDSKKTDHAGGFAEFYIVMSFIIVIGICGILLGLAWRRRKRRRRWRGDGSAYAHGVTMTSLRDQELADDSDFSDGYISSDDDAAIAGHHADDDGVAPAATSGGSADSRRLPSGWSEVTNAAGRFVYFKHVSGKTQWERPRSDLAADSTVEEDDSGAAALSTHAVELVEEE